MANKVIYNQDKKEKDRILIAEDDPCILRAITSFMENEGIAIDTSRNGEEALKKINKFKYKLILLDLIMPIKTGFDVLKELNSKDNPPPALIFSNFDQQEYKDRALSLGAKDYFVKHKLNISELPRIVKIYLKGNIR